MATWLALGSFFDLDPTEGDINSISEDAGLLVGDSWDQTSLGFVTTSYNDVNGDGLLAEGPTSETFTIDGTDHTLDSIQAYDASILLGDGSTINVPVGIAQMEDGSAYLIPSTETSLDSLNIQEVTLTGLPSGQYVGMATSSADRSIDNSAVVCFAAGTLIDTPQGLRPVEDLRAGDLITTLDHGAQPLGWRALAAGHWPRGARVHCGGHLWPGAAAARYPGVSAAPHFAEFLVRAGLF